VTRAGVFANLWNKIGKILKIFERLGLTESPTESVKYLGNRYLDCLELAEDPPTSEVI
jgi:hypothetical protein